MFRPLPLIVLGAALAAPTVADPLAVEDAWVRALPPTQSVTAGYLVVTNRGDDTVRIVGAAASGAGRAELHESRAEDGAMRMVPVAVLPLAPGESASFEPGGLHLMLMQAVDAIPTEGEIPLALLLADGERLEFTAPVGQPAE